MRTVSVFAFAALATMGAALPAAYIEANEALLWQSFKDTHGKVYAGADEAHRRSVFLGNMLKASELERQNPKAQFGMSPFADLTEAEFKTRHNLTVRPSQRVPALFSEEEVAQQAKSVDWRKKGAVTHVKNQGQCGSCWAFSTTGGIEGQWAVAGNPLTAVSEQELVSCDTVDLGCNGGLMDDAFKWLVSAQKGGIATEQSYPYASGSGAVPHCHAVPSKDIGATITGFKDLPGDEGQMAKWLSTHGPISIAVDASTWQTYTGGVMTNCPFHGLDHGVLIVGYESDAWVIKNSWGTSWGESGYIRVGRGSGLCGVGQYQTHPLV